MERVTLGRTGLSVSVAGLGCGGHSRLGQSYGHSFEQSVSVVRAAMEAGVNFFDTAASYRTEDIVGAAVRSCRDQVVISSKLGVVRPGTDHLGQDYLSGADFVKLVDKNLQRLGTDYIDIFHLHGVMPDQYEYCASELVPALLKLREQGKIRFLGLTERFIYDTRHDMLQRALKDACWDVVMTGFNLLNPSARRRVFAETQAGNVGTLVMFAVRRALSNPQAAREIVNELVRRDEIAEGSIDHSDPLGFLCRPGVAGSVVEAAYRFCRHEPGAHVVLTGTGSLSHLTENLASIVSPPLPAEVTQKLQDIFGSVDSVSGN